MTITEKELLALKEKIGKTKTEIAELKGQDKMLMQELADKWGCKSIKAAERKREQFKAEAEELERVKEKGLAEIEERYK